MAHVVLTAVVSTVLNQLTSPALEEVLLLCNCRNELRRLKDTVGAIRDVLRDAEERQSEERLVQGWLRRLKAVMYDADDLLDQVVVRALRKQAMTGSSFMKEVRLFLTKSNHLAFVFQTAHRVKDIRKSLDNIAQDMSRFNFIPHRNVDRRNVRVHGDETQSFVTEEYVFGREEERVGIISMLLPEVEGESSSSKKKDISVIAIIGFGGIGKTALAQLVYNDSIVKEKFKLRLWVCINYFSDLNQVLKAIIASSGQKPESLVLDQLQGQLRKIIGNRKLLLVFDNVWDEDRSNWLKLKLFLNCAASESRVLVTTRSRAVAQCLDASEPCFELKVLSEESAWSLFVKTAFKEQELVEGSDLEPLGRKIVQKCGFVPLAVITIGSLLHKKGKDKQRWLPFLDNQLPEVVSFDENKMMQTLKISYDDLPANLKLCFAYCSLFPKDYRFHKDELVRLWLAQGFLGEEGEESFFDLVERCFFQELQVVDKHGFRRYLCKMHDLLHDLATEVAGTEYTVIVRRVTDELKGKAFRHITFDCELDPEVNYTHIFADSKALRTLICSPKAICANSSLSTLLSGFRMLRTLDLSCIQLVKIPKSIGELIHMRYLNLSENGNLKSLPNSICKLLHLQTLNLSWCKSLEELPSDIGKLARLSYLMLNGCKKLTFLPPGISALTLLVSLDRLIVHRQYGGLRYLDCLDNLCGNLTIEFPMMKWPNAVEDARKSNVFKKHKLNGLILSWEKAVINSDQRLSKGEVEEMLEAISPHANLHYLKITECGAGKLPTWVSSHQNIKELNLECWHEMEYMEDTLIPGPFFPTTEILTIDDMDNIRGWWREVAATDDIPCFPRVSKVSISRCPKLVERMPKFSQISELTLTRVDSEAVRQLLIGSVNSSNRLKKLQLEQISGLEYLLDFWVAHLTSLETLVIACCKELRWVSSGGLANLTALEELKFEECGKVELIDEYGEMEYEDDDEGFLWKALQRLRVLELPIRDIHFAKGVQYLTELEDLAIYSWQQKEEDDDDEEETPWNWRCLERVRKLTVGFDQNPCHFPEEIQYLRFLKQLVISDCRELSIIWTALAKLKLLQSLTFCRVENVIQDDFNGTPHNMTLLKFEECHGELEWMNQIPWGFLPSLHSLAFVYMPDLECLPEGIQKLNSLQQLDILSCQNLTSLPNWMIKLTSLQSLVVAICSDELKERCAEETGADQRHIRHIPYVRIW